MIDAIYSDKSLPESSIIEAMQMLIFLWDDVFTTAVQKCLKKAGFSDEEKENPDDPFSTLKHSIEQLQPWEESLVFDDVSCNDFLSFDGEVAVTQDTLTREMIVEEMQVDESRYKKKRKRKSKTNKKLTCRLWRNWMHHKYVKRLICHLNTCM